LINNIVRLATNKCVGNKTMLYQVEKYINRKGIQQKIQVNIDESILKALDEIVLHFGEDIFNRNKSIFSQQIIENTIPTMINNGITDLKNNLLKLKSVKKNSLNHYKLIYGNNAEQIYNERTEKSLQTKDNFIKRHGEKQGTILWGEYSKKKSKQNTLEGFIERFGPELGRQKFEEYSNRQSYTNSIEYYIEKYGEDNGGKLYYQRYPAYEYSKDYKDYKNAVYRLSQKIYEDNKEKINPNNYLRTRMGVNGGWQLDHIKPVIECFHEGISIEEASDINNLRMLPWKENLMRNFE
jgi:hypothetical protein